MQRINKYGFIETPYVKVENGSSFSWWCSLIFAADEEDGLFIAQADNKIR